MRYVALLLSLWFSVLTQVPCDDTLLLSSQHQVESYCVHINDHTEHCSPLCYCHCCHSPVVAVVWSMPVIVFLHVFKEFNYRISVGQEVITPIWHPPKA